MSRQTFIKIVLLIQIIGLTVASYVPYSDKQDRIINGNKAQVGDFPHQVSLRRVEDSKHFCGGAILSEYWIITSAQCTQDLHSLPDNIFVVVGTVNMTRGGLEYAVEKIVSHPHFNWEKRRNDIAMLKTNQPMKISDGKVFPIALPSFKTNYTIENGIGLTEVTLSGWGSCNVEGSKIEPSEILRFLKTSHLQRRMCRRHLGRVNGLLLNENHLCANVKEGQRINVGDIGSPLVTNDGQLVGIASWQHSTGYEIGYPDVYTRIFPYKSWIWNNLMDPNDILI
ncbi:mite allergen Der p 3-like [Contarinia nasturtii]|uniref:mite allergen Der p 3-like n=1 Tax=Contarinia nasturtii TaxID=265458 RepID=UPI0012D45643|nr:mite allergen Der p 3-like [Contarinia nasturtii]